MPTTPRGAPNMGKTLNRRVTAQDIARAEGGLAGMIKGIVRAVKGGDDASKEAAAAQLRSLAQQDHGAHQVELFEAGVVTPLVMLLSHGTASAQASASAALASVMSGKAKHQKAFVEAGGVVPLCSLLKMGSPKVQEEAACALAAIDEDIDDQTSIIKAGAVTTLIAMLKGTSAAGQAFAAQSLANAAAHADGAT